jgi:hypothetical protein
MRPQRHAADTALFCAASPLNPLRTGQPGKTNRFPHTALGSPPPHLHRGLAHRCHIDVARVQAALIHLTQTLALEWARHKIRVAHLT